MTIKMRLDTEGLRSLIKDNPELEVEIGKAVMNNIRDDAVAGKVLSQIETCLRGMVKQSSGWPATYEAKSPELVSAVNKMAEKLIAEVLDKKLEQAIEAKVSTYLATQHTVDTRTLRAQLSELLTPEMARELMREKILL